MCSLFSLSGKVALLTGGTNGIGLGYAKGLASANLKQLILTYRSNENLQFAIEEIKKVNDSIIIDSIYVDFVKEDEDEIVERITSEAYKLSQTGKIDILINNAGITNRSAFESFEQEKFDQVIKVDLNIPVKLTKSIGSKMLENNTQGKIIFTASLLSFQGGMNSTPYAIAKGGLKQFTQALSNEWSSRGIRINCIAPGYIETKLTSNMDEEHRNLVNQRIPMNRWGNLEDFMGPIVFLCSDASKYITGETILVDGGWMGR
ncbi:unnamed protein product [Candida verbasci]|uniref:2-deoxy-D-gluconate 3-dehydrogenase n=1 Tax=Candida verbasci TaxID=1227364 RepID=A0A9W4U0Y7_9ASCO|nr:unnamed protein product [Candida verbasci]